MMAYLYLLGIILFSYCMGSINFAVIFSKVFAKKDVRNYGSGNAGMTNVIRVIGVLPGLLTLILDALKGAVSCYVGKFFAFPMIYEMTGIEAFNAEYGMYYCGIFCILGHVFPLFFQFKGGKGIATSLGIILVCHWQIGVVGIAAFLILFLCSGIISLGSVAAAIAIPFPAYFCAETEGLSPYTAIIQCALMAVVSVIVLIKHRDNIKRLIKGEEKPLKAKKK